MCEDIQTGCVDNYDDKTTTYQHADPATHVTTNLVKGLSMTARFGMNINKKLLNSFHDFRETKLLINKLKESIIMTGGDLNKLPTLPDILIEQNNIPAGGIS